MMIEMTDDMKAAIEKMDAEQQRRYNGVVKAFNAGMLSDEDVHQMLMGSKRMMGQTWFAPESLKAFKASTGKALPDVAKRLVERIPFLEDAARSNILPSLVKICVANMQMEVSKKAAPTPAAPIRTPKMDAGM